MRKKRIKQSEISIRLLLTFVEMSQKMNKQQTIFGIALVVLAASMKVITFPFSINPIIAISLFSGTLIKDRKLAFLLPLVAMLFSDIMLEFSGIADGFYGWGQIGNYFSLLAVAALGFGIQKPNFFNVPAFSIFGSVLFFFLSNTSVFLFDTQLTYGSGFAGWASCLTAGIPFVKNAAVIDLSFSVLIFGTYALMSKTANKEAKA
jgi:hypothetical protein